MKIKICGLTDPKEADYLNQIQADYAGFVLFFPKSKRNVSIPKAKEIMAALSPSIQKVAVVVSPTPERVREICDSGFDVIQIHGTLSEEIFPVLTIPVWRAFNVTQQKQYEDCHALPQVEGYVLDAPEPGSGKTFDWSLISQFPKDGKLFFLAGGLHPDNVRTAIQALHPDGVDVSSGVEFTDRPGKDPAKIQAFATQVRKASLDD